MHYGFSFPSGTVDYYHHAKWEDLQSITGNKKPIFITDSNVAEQYPDRFKEHNTLVIPAGEKHKTMDTVVSLANQLVQLKAHRESMLIGVGGGVVTDITGFLASTYMRGIPFGFVPSSLLGMVDAAIGGKNGVNLGLHKNMLGNFKQPRFILFDISLLQTLPDNEWSNGFAEIIKYGCIGDAYMLNSLEIADISYYRRNPEMLTELIHKCVEIKNKIVNSDEKDEGMRQLLNFGHTTGHAFETLYDLPHGSAVGLGILVACVASEEHIGLPIYFRMKIQELMQQFGLPVSLDFDVEKVMAVLQMDKKMGERGMDFIMLEKMGKACIVLIPLEYIKRALQRFADESDN